MGKIYVEIQGGLVTLLAPSWGRPCSPDSSVQLKMATVRILLSNSDAIADYSHSAQN